MNNVNSFIQAKADVIKWLSLKKRGAFLLRTTPRQSFDVNGIHAIQQIPALKELYIEQVSNKLTGGNEANAMTQMKAHFRAVRRAYEVYEAAYRELAVRRIKGIIAANLAETNKQITQRIQATGINKWYFQSSNFGPAFWGEIIREVRGETPRDLHAGFKSLHGEYREQ